MISFFWLFLFGVSLILLFDFALVSLCVMSANCLSCLSVRCLPVPGRVVYILWRLGQITV